MKIEIVPDEMGTCPRCGAYWGHPDQALDFPNRQKVDDWWRCYNPACEVRYFVPGTNRVELEPTPEEAERIAREAKEWVAKITFGKTWVETSPGTWTLR